MDLACSSTVVQERLFERLGVGPHQLRRTRTFGGGGSAGVREHDHFVLTVVESERHFWSPWLNVEVTPREGGAHLFARFSPHPSVWTMFAFAYLAMTTLLLLSLCFAAALSMSGSAPWGLAVSAGAVVVMLLLWAASQVGQRLAHAQMVQLRLALDEAVDECMGPESVTRHAL